MSALNAGDVEGYLAGFSAASLRWVDGQDSPLTVAEMRDNLTQLTSAFRDLHLDEGLLFGGQGRACALWILRGNHTGVYGGIEPTYREIAVRTCEVYTLSEDDHQRVPRLRRCPWFVHSDRLNQIKHGWGYPPARISSQRRTSGRSRRHRSE